MSKDKQFVEKVTAMEEDFRPMVYRCCETS